MTFRERSRKKVRNVSDKIVKWIGSGYSLLWHTIFFLAMVTLAFSGKIDPDKVMLVLTTIVSLEAIYLSIFIQMTVNRHSEELEEVTEGIEDIQEDVEDIQEDIDEIQEDVEDIQEDVEDIQEDVDEIQEDVEDIQDDVKEEK